MLVLTLLTLCTHNITPGEQQSASVIGQLQCDVQLTVATGTAPASALYSYVCTRVLIPKEQHSQHLQT